MKITYTPNPLDIIIELDDHEKEILKLKIRVKEFEEMAFSAHFYLAEGKQFFSVEKAREELDPEYWCTDGESKMDRRVNELFEHFIEELAGSHDGDCTCVACSCSKCHAESIIDVYTTKGLGKHEGHKIKSAFNYRDGDVWKTRTFDEALSVLENYKFLEPAPEHTEAWKRAGGWEQHVPRWTQENKNAITWLKNYRDEHLTNTQ